MYGLITTYLLLMDTELERRANESRWDVRFGDCSMICYKFNPATAEKTRYTMYVERVFVLCPLMCLCFNGGGNDRVSMDLDETICGVDLTNQGSLCLYPYCALLYKEECVLSPLFCQHESSGYKCCLGVPWKKKGREIFLPACCCLDRTTEDKDQYQIEKIRVCGVKVSETVLKTGPAPQAMV